MPSPSDEIARLAAAASGPPAPAPAPRPTGYRAATRTATYGFLAALPLFVLYEVGVLLANTGPGQVRVGADVWLKTLLGALGGPGGPRWAPSCSRPGRSCGGASGTAGRPSWPATSA